MEDVARFLMDGLDQGVGALIQVAFWKLGVGLVLGTALVVFIAGLPEDYRGPARAVAVVAIGLAVMVFAFGPLEWRDILG